MAVTIRQTKAGAGSLFLRHLGHDKFDLLLLYLFLIGLTSIPITIIILVVVFRNGHTTVFPPEDPHSGWTDEPVTRGTLRIISVCFSTTFTCVYVSVHVGLPKTYTNRGRIWQTLTNPAHRKFYWVLFNIFAPELMVLVALCELQSAIAGVSFMRNHGRSDWSMTLAFFADMGGFRRSDGYVFETGREFYRWFAINQPDIDCKELENEIEDRSKANSVLKMYTCAQAVWFLIETSLRFAELLPVSELEVTTCTYILCAVVTYGCWFHKPYGVNHPITLNIQPSSLVIPRFRTFVMTSTDENVAMADTGFDTASRSNCEALDSSASSLCPTETHESRSKYSLRLLPNVSESLQNVETSIPLDDLPKPLFPEALSTPFNRAYRDPGKAWFVACHGASCMGSLIGVFHASAFWNTIFVNSEGQWVWRACCMAQVLVPVGLALVALLEYRYNGFFLWLFLLYSALVYCMARTALFALIYLSFKGLPSDVYQNVHSPLDFMQLWG